MTRAVTKYVRELEGPHQAQPLTDELLARGRF